MKKIVLFLCLLFTSFLFAEPLDGIFISRFRDDKREVGGAFNDLGWPLLETNLNYDIYGGTVGTYGNLPVDEIIVNFACHKFYEFTISFSAKANLDDINYLVEEILKKDFELKYYNGTAIGREHREYQLDYKIVPEKYIDESVIIFNKNSRKLTIRDVTFFEEISKNGNKKDSFTDNIIYRGF